MNYLFYGSVTTKPIFSSSQSLISQWDVSALIWHFQKGTAPSPHTHTHTPWFRWWQFGLRLWRTFICLLCSWKLALSCRDEGTPPYLGHPNYESWCRKSPCKATPSPFPSFNYNSVLLKVVIKLNVLDTGKSRHLSCNKQWALAKEDHQCALSMAMSKISWALNCLTFCGARLSPSRWLLQIRLFAFEFLPNSLGMYEHGFYELIMPNRGASLFSLILAISPDSLAISVIVPLHDNIRVAFLSYVPFQNSHNSHSCLLRHLLFTSLTITMLKIAVLCTFDYLL